MTELLDGLWRASLWLAVGVALLAVLRPLLVRLGGAGLAYRSWWLLPLLLVALTLPLPQVAVLQQVPTLPLKVMPGALDALSGPSLPWAGLLFALWALGAGIHRGQAVLARTPDQQRCRHDQRSGLHWVSSVLSMANVIGIFTAAATGLPFFIAGR